MAFATLSPQDSQLSRIQIGGIIVSGMATLYSDPYMTGHNASVTAALLFLPGCTSNLTRSQITTVGEIEFTVTSPTDSPPPS